MDAAGPGDRHSDDELASALEDEVARITSAIPIVVQPGTVRGGSGGAVTPAAAPEGGATGLVGHAEGAGHAEADGDDVGLPAERISFDDLPSRPTATGPEPTFSPWVATAAIPIQRESGMRPAEEGRSAVAAGPVAATPVAATPVAATPAAAAAKPAAPTTVVPGADAPAAGTPSAAARPPVTPPVFPSVARAEPLDRVPEDLAPRDSQPVPRAAATPPAAPATAGPPAATAAVPPAAHEPSAPSGPLPALVGAPLTGREHDDELWEPYPARTEHAAHPAHAARNSGRHARGSILTPEASDLEPTPLDRRVGRASRVFWLWFAGTSSLISVGVGATLFVLGLSLRQLLVATLVGVALSFLPLGLGTLAGKWSGQPTLVVSRASFGMRGNIVPTVLALVVKLFWGAVLLWLAGSAAGSLTGAEGWPGNAAGATIVALAATIIVAVAIAYAGYALVARVQLALTIASAVLIALMVVATWRHVDMTRALSAPDALWTHVVTGAVLVFSYVGLSWAMSSAEVARYQRPESSGGGAMLWATFGAGVPPFVLVSYGGLLAASDPGLASRLAQDPVAGLVALGLPAWYPVPLLLAVGLSLISALVLTLYSAGFTIDALGVRVGRRWSTLIAGAAVAIAGGVLAATVSDLSAVVRGVPTALSVPVAAWVGVFSGEMMLRTRRLHSPSLLNRGGVYPDWRWTNLALLIAGTAVGLGTVSSPLPWLTWEGYLFRLAGIDPQEGVGTSNVGVVIALVIGLGGALVSAAPAVRRQEQVTD